MKFAVLSSGSKANSTYIEAGGTAVLIDCGLSAKETEKRMGLLGLRPEGLSAILITHEHSDHVYGVSVFSRRYKLPVFANKRTAKKLKSVFAHEQFATGHEFDIGALKVHPFSIAHDAVDPVGFTIRGDGLQFSQATDLGRITTLVEDAVRGAHALVLESNHDEDMLRDCHYPWELKQRISSTHGHLSNHTAASFLSHVKHPEMRHVVLGHLSENSNTPELAVTTLDRYLSKDDFSSFCCGSVYQSTPLWEVCGPELRSAV